MAPMVSAAIVMNVHACANLDVFLSAADFALLAYIIILL